MTINLPTKPAHAALRAGDWLMYHGVRYEVSAVVVYADARVEVSTATGHVLTFDDMEDAVSAIYSRVEDRHSEIALDLRVKEAMLASQLHMHLMAPATGPEAELVQMELMYALMEVRRRMASRGQRASKAAQVEVADSQPFSGGGGVKPK